MDFLLPDSLKAIGMFVNQVGFPVFVALAMIWVVWRLHRENRADLKEMQNAINNVCEVLHTLVNRTRRE
jgi:uncharacterized protein YjiS (DUF1127 family)